MSLHAPDPRGKVLPVQGIIMAAVIRSLALSPVEAAAFADLPEGKVRKEVEHGLFGAKSPPRLSFVALVYLRVLRSAELELGVAARRLLFERIADALKKPKPPDLLELNEVWILKLGPLVRELAERIERFERWKKQRVVLRDDILGGEPVFAGTRLAVRRVGALAERGETTKAILEDYPYLEPSDLDFARLYAKAYPRLGRPREAR